MNNSSTIEVKTLLYDIRKYLKKNLLECHYQNTLKNNEEFIKEEENIKNLLIRCEKILTKSIIDENENKIINPNKRFSCKKQLQQQQNQQEQEYHYDKSNQIPCNSEFNTLDDETDISSLNEYGDVNIDRYLSCVYHSFNENNNYDKTCFNTKNLEIITKTNENIVQNIPEILSKSKTHFSCKRALFKNDINNEDENKIKNNVNNDFKFKMKLSQSIMNLSNGKNNEILSKKNENKINKINCLYQNLKLKHIKDLMNKILKMGFLLKIEKKKFLFDNSKELYCIVIENWLLCYDIFNNNNDDNIIDNSNENNIFDNMNLSTLNESELLSLLSTSTSISSKFSSSSSLLSLLNLMPVICINLNKESIEHYGDGKKRDITFQIFSSNNQSNSTCNNSSDDNSNSENNIDDINNDDVNNNDNDYKTDDTSSSSFITLSTSPSLLSNSPKIQSKFLSTTPLSTSSLQIPSSPIINCNDKQNSKCEDIYEEPMHITLINKRMDISQLEI
ncbi:putative uncharacterized protein DDB_G0282133 [Condylostylus longicornis]|uniref:putative uncharacterized protein DDB_G0282133 n=1 Tax=Condylostylus longicornis TaxID=2530218 RepID=UPI00244E0370|nr:putative uncharacterized protein DDB_G0282133 [Condylostylus longicornis]